MRGYGFWIGSLAVLLGALSHAMAAPKICVTQAQASTSGGDQTFTCGQSIGTRDAAIFVATYAVSLDTTTADAMFSIGMTDGSNQASIMTWSEDAELGSTAQTRAATDEVLQFAPAPFTFGECNFQEWTDSGVTVTWGRTPSRANRVVVILFAGLADAYVGTATSPADVDSELDVTAPAFEPDQVIVISRSYAFDDTAQEDCRLSIGLVDNDGSSPYPQASYNWFSDYGSTSAVAAITRDDRVLQDLTTSTAGDIEIDSFDADGFSLFTRRAGANVIAYLALRYSSDGSVAHWVGSLTSPTSTGEWSVSAPGFKPQFVLLLPSRCLFDDAIELDNDAAPFGLGMFTADDEYSASAVDKDAVSTTDTASRMEDQAAAFLNAAQSLGWEGYLASFVVSGWNLQMSAAVGSGRQWAALAVEEGPELTVLDFERGQPGLNRGVLRGVSP
jgi:hypothetical protein